LLVALFREATTRNNDLQKLIRNSVSLDENGQPKLLPSTVPIDADAKAELSTWLGRLENGTSQLDLDELGVRVSRRSRPGTLIISSKVINALKAMVASQAQ
jgi:hypothetical protein